MGTKKITVGFGLLELEGTKKNVVASMILS